jgi:hypothetical protein
MLKRQSQFIGVYANHTRGVYDVYITENGKDEWVGSNRDELLAAAYYNTVCSRRQRDGSPHKYRFNSIKKHFEQRHAERELQRYMNAEDDAAPSASPA